MAEELWFRSRSGANAGRGFHYQDAVATELAIRAWRGELSLKQLMPEGLEDISLELDVHWLHLQAKSRREHRGQFSLADLAPAWRHLAERLAVDKGAKGGVVLERPLRGLVTGFERTLAEVASDDTRQTIAASVAGLLDAGDFLGRTHVIVIPSPEQTAVELLADRLDLPLASCVAHQAILRSKLAGLADENGKRTYHEPAAISIGDIARLIDDINEAIDPSLLDEAVRDGVAELVDFGAPIDDERFFSGVDVVAGHIVAGLPLLRPEVQLLADGLAARQVALAVGPSGAGKSALIWLAAYTSRHDLRWYRVRRLRENDVAALVRLVKGLSPYGAKVGFVIDDLGREDRAGFDHLVQELRNQPTACVLGACREEDLFIVTTAHSAAQVRPSLEPELAERIWRELHLQGRTTWPQWREPYERSQGLLLEYGHLLTEGTHLIETVASQVDRRIREQRGLELDVLALVTTADAFGAEISATQLATALAVDAGQMRGALARLVDEHLIHEHDGLLGGLHELRSRHVMAEVHRLSSPALTSTVRRVVDLVTHVGLQPFMTRVLFENAVADEVVIDAAAARLQRDLDPTTLAIALHVLRLVGLRRTATKWREILMSERIAPAHANVAITFERLEGTGLFPQPLQSAISRIRQLDMIDLRGMLLKRVEHQMPLVMANATHVQSVAALLAALGEVDQSVTVDPVVIAGLVDGATLTDVRLLLDTAHFASADLATAIVDNVGGSAALLQRLEREQPWVRGAHLDLLADGRVTAEAEYAYVAESAQPEPHGAVVEVAGFLAALTPAAEIAVCRAVDASGKTAGFAGVPVADKRIERRNLPSSAQVAWNRARGRAAIAAVAAPTETDHLLAVREIVRSASQFVRRIGDTWARGVPPVQRLRREASSLAEAANRLAPSPIAIEAAGPLEEGELPLDTPCNFVGTMLANNLFPRLFKGDNVAALIPQIAKKVDELAMLQRWDLIDEPPFAELAELQTILRDLHDVLLDQIRGGSNARTSLATARRRGLAAGATVARQHAVAHFRAVADQLRVMLATANVKAHVLHREPESHHPPGEDFLILVELPAVYDWLRTIEMLSSLCRPALQGQGPFLMAPVRDGYVVASLGIKVIQTVFPDQSVRDWRELPLPLLHERLGDEVRRGLKSLDEVSGIIGSIRGNMIHDEEFAALQAATASARGVLQYVTDLVAGREAKLLVQIRAVLHDLSRMVEDEGAALAQGKRVGRGVAALVLAGLNGEVNEVFLARLNTLLACAEWDVDPGGAWDRVQRALQNRGLLHLSWRARTGPDLTAS
jgi:hypothetical protein